MNATREGFFSRRMCRIFNFSVPRFDFVRYALATFYV